MAHVGVKVNGFLEILFLEFCKSKAKTLVFVEITRIFDGKQTIFG